MQSCAPLSRPPPGFGATYFFPPPWIVWDKNIQKRDQYVHNYIRIREFCPWQTFLEDFQDLPKRTEYWREAIKGNYTNVSSLDNGLVMQAILTQNDTLLWTSSDNAELLKRVPRKVLRGVAQTDFGCNGELIPWNPDIVVKWKGKDIWYQVKYELYELNWRAELLTLDLKITLKKDSLIDHVKQRKELVGQVWNSSNSEVILFPIPSEDKF